jgi:hypothetical protein
VRSRRKSRLVEAITSANDRCHRDPPVWVKIDLSAITSWWRFSNGFDRSALCPIAGHQIYLGSKRLVDDIKGVNLRCPASRFGGPREDARFHVAGGKKFVHADNISTKREGKKDQHNDRMRGTKKKTKITPHKSSIHIDTRRFIVRWRCLSGPDFERWPVGKKINESCACVGVLHSSDRCKMKSMAFQQSVNLSAVGCEGPNSLHRLIGAYGRVIACRIYGSEMTPPILRRGATFRRGRSCAGVAVDAVSHLCRGAPADAEGRPSAARATSSSRGGGGGGGGISRASTNGRGKTANLYS